MSLPKAPYLIKTPFYLKKIFGSMTWDIPTPDGEQPCLYLTFDDGPTPGVTEFVLDELARVGAKGTFFLIGKHAEAHPELVQRMLEEGHAIGNHTYSHLNGWKTSDNEYFSDMAHCSRIVNSTLFRPPYGRIKITQIEEIKKDYRIVMWDVISGDFDTTVEPQDCLENVLGSAKDGSIVVMHDSIKAEQRLRHALPVILDHFVEKGYRFPVVKSLPVEAV